MPRTVSFPPRIRLPSVVSEQYVRHWYDALGLQSEAYRMTKKSQLCPEFDSVNLMVIFNGAANNSDYIASNVLMPVSDELEIAWREVLSPDLMYYLGGFWLN